MEMPPQETRLRLLELIKDELQKSNVEINGEHADLTALSNEEVLGLFDDLVHSGKIVLHGTNTDKPYEALEPRQANDAAKESGNKKAVYATIDKLAALNHAIFNVQYVREKLRSYVWGEQNASDGQGNIIKTEVRMSPELYQLFKEHDPNVMSDGYVYVLDKNAFITAPDTGGTEFHSEEKQAPLIVCKASKRLGDVLFVIGQGDKDTVREYTSEELSEIKVNREKWAER